MFLKEDDGKLRLIDSTSDRIEKSLKPGLYNVEVFRSMFGKAIFFKPNDNFKKGQVAKAGIFKDVNDFVNDYFSPEGKEVRRVMDLPSRVGLLFKGEPGTGKTYLACKLAEELAVKENAICILTSSFSQLDFTDLTDAIRRGNDPNQLIIYILDEFEKDYGNCDEGKFLGFLDGTDSRNNVMVIATANIINKLPSTLLKRPGRFEKVLDFKINSPEILRIIIDNMIPTEYKQKLSIDTILSLISKDKEITIDKIKSIVRDSIVGLLKGKTEEDIRDSINSNLIYKNEEDKEKKKKPGIKTNGNTEVNIQRLFNKYMEDELEVPKSGYRLRNLLSDLGIPFADEKEENIKHSPPISSNENVTAMTEEDLMKELNF